MTESARDILDRRLAAGELSLAEFDEMVARLDGKPATSVPIESKSYLQQQGSPPPQWAPMPKSAEHYESLWQKANLVALLIALVVPLVVLKQVVPWLLTTSWGLSVLAWLVVVIGNVFDGVLSRDQVAAIVVSFLTFLPAVLVAKGIGDFAAKSVLKAVDPKASDVPSDLKASIDRRNIAFPTLIRVDVLRGHPGIALVPKVNNLFMMVIVVALVGSNWLFR